jgi:hypothetical protein
VHHTNTNAIDLKGPTHMDKIQVHGTFHMLVQNDEAPMQGSFIIVPHHLSDYPKPKSRNELCSDEMGIERARVFQNLLKRAWALAWSATTPRY